MMKYSIIVPVYNKAETVGDALKSIYAQTVDDYEILVVDDGSTDDLQRILEKLKLDKLKVFRQENGGVSQARNTGIAHASGEYLCFLDADDLWKTHHLQTMDELIRKYPEARVFVTANETVLMNGSVSHGSDVLRKYDEDFETEDFIGLLNRTSYALANTNSFCIKKEIMDKAQICFEPEIRIGEDTDVWYRLGSRHKVAVSRRETTVYRRCCSTATKRGFHVQDWIFCRRVPEILCDERISPAVKESVICLMDRYKMACSREYMAEGNRKEARRVLQEVRDRCGKRYVLTKLFTYMPYWVCRHVLRGMN